MKELTEGQRKCLATALAYKLGSRCWYAGVEQVAREVDGYVLISPWAAGSFSTSDLEFITSVWSSRGASSPIELVISDHVKVAL